MDLIKKTLSFCGYEGEATEENLISCFYDYVDSGAFNNLTLEEAKELIENEELTLKGICFNLLKIR